jgi:Zn-dependent protease with chaperone function
MNKYNHFILVVAYSLLSSALLLLLLSIFCRSLILHSAGTQFYCMVCWLLFCLSGVYWWPDLMLAKMNVRLCILEEEQLLLPCVQEIQEKTGQTIAFRFYILEDEGPNAFALGKRTIVVSRGLLTLLNQPELLAVVAHEIGHLQSKDGVAGAAFSVALFTTRLVRKVFRTALRPFPSLFRSHSYYRGVMVVVEFLQGTLILALLLLVCMALHVLHLLLAALCLVVCFYLLDQFFLFLWRWSARLNEYRQDNFAHRLGYGGNLKDALLKITRCLPPQPLNLYTVLTYHDHPVIYNRIRRLEKLAGLR